METFDLMTEGGHEQLVFWNDPEFGYRGIIAIHDTTLGPALGGTRFWDYDSDREAIVDALRLSRGMTFKASVSGLNLGGGKSVIWGDNKTPDREMIFRAHGRAVDSLNGRYITAEDVGTSPDDMDFVAMETDHVVGLHGRSGDPSPVTAYGVYRGIKASAAVKYGSDSLADKHIGVHENRLDHDPLLSQPPRIFPKSGRSVRWLQIPAVERRTFSRCFRLCRSRYWSSASLINSLCFFPTRFERAFISPDCRSVR